MKSFFVFIIAVTVLLNGCASILDGKFVTEKGKDSPYIPKENPYDPPRDPTARY